MALEESDKAEIAAMIAEATRASQPPRPAAPASSPTVSQGDWDRMGERDRQAYVRSMVEDHLASLDAEAERAELKEQNRQMRAELDEWRKGGKKGPRPTKGAGDKPAEEQAPSIVSKAYAWLFGAPTT